MSPVHPVWVRLEVRPRTVKPMSRTTKLITGHCCTRPSQRVYHSDGGDWAVAQKQRRQMTSCRAGKTTAFASNSLQHPISVAFSVAVARSWMEKLPTLWRDRGPVSSPEFAFNGLTAPHTPRQSIGMRRSMGLDRRILQITFDVHGKTDAFEEKDAKT